MACILLTIILWILFFIFNAGLDTGSNEMLQAAFYRYKKIITITTRPKDFKGNWTTFAPAKYPVVIQTIL